MGLRTAKYVSKEELEEFLAIGAFCGILEKTVAGTKDKELHRLLKTAETNIKKAIDVRVAHLDPVQFKSVMRREKNTRVLMQSIDEKRFEQALGQEVIRIDQEDLMEIAELALNSCTVCTQGDCVEGCRFRKVMHRVGIPVVNDNPASGKCEFFTQTKEEATNEG